MKAVIVAADIITPYGQGVETCWRGLLSGKSAVSRVSRFNTSAFQSDYAGTVSGLRYHEQESLVMQMLSLLLDTVSVPQDARLMLATTKGEIDLLEQSVLHGKGNAQDSVISRLMAKVAGLTGVIGETLTVSAACTSSAAAIARAAALIRNGHADCVFVAACDSVTEFIFSGFSSLMAMDKVPARPFDRNRAGLSVGEAAAYALIMSEERAARENREIIGEVSGWGLSDDANHMTGPSRESEGLILAIRKALLSAGAEPGQIGVIAAHGTGTIYNDEMEIRAFRSLFKTTPVYSIKGGIGHTMGAAGLVETLIALQSLKDRIVPPTVNLQEPDKDAEGWVSSQEQALGQGGMALVTNAGFSGVNTALVLR